MRLLIDFSFFLFRTSLLDGIFWRDGGDVRRMEEDIGFAGEMKGMKGVGWNVYYIVYVYS